MIEDGWRTFKNRLVDTCHGEGSVTMQREQQKYDQAVYELIVKITQCGCQFQQTKALIIAHDSAMRAVSP